MTLLYIMKIEIDGHFHGSSDVPQPWVAQLLGPCPKYGLQREFVQKMNDWKQAKRAWSGNIYGRVAHFPMRDGNVYEVSRCRGNSSKRYVAREFAAIEGGKRVALDPLEALARVDGGHQAAVLPLPEDLDGTTWVASVTGLGTPSKLGFVVTQGKRRYRLRSGLYEVVERGRQRFVAVTGESIEALREKECLEWLSRNAG